MRGFFIVSAMVADGEVLDHALLRLGHGGWAETRPAPPHTV